MLRHGSTISRCAFISIDSESTHFDGETVSLTLERLVVQAAASAVSLRSGVVSCSLWRRHTVRVEAGAVPLVSVDGEQGVNKLVRSDASSLEIRDFCA